MSMSSDYDIGSYEDIQEMRREAKGSRQMAKTYLKCSAKARETNFGQVIKLGIKVDEFIAFARQHVNERGYVNLEIAPRKEVGPYGDTHSVSLDDYVKGSGKTAPSPAGYDHSAPVTDSDIPF